MGTRAAPRASRAIASLAAVPARRAARVADPGTDPVARRGRPDAAPRLVAAGFLGGDHRRPRRWQGLPASREMAAPLLSRHARLPARPAGDRDPPGNRAAPRNHRRYAPRGRIRAALRVRPDRALSGRARGCRSGADHRLLLQRLPDADPGGGDPGQLHLHEPDRLEIPRIAHLHGVPDGRRGAPSRSRLESAQWRRPGRLLCALSLFDRAAGGALAAGPGAAPAGREPAGALPRAGGGRPRRAAIGGGRRLARRHDARRARQPDAERRRVRERRARAAYLLALSARPGAAMAPASARPAARRVLHRQGARGKAARGELFPGGARDRRAHHARHQEPAAIAERALLGGHRP